MIKMSSSSRALLQNKYPELFAEEDVDRFLLALDAIITRDGLDDNDNMTAFGRDLQSVYDEVYMCSD